MSASPRAFIGGELDLRKRSGNRYLIAYVRSTDQDGNVDQIDSAGLRTYAQDDAFRITGLTDTSDPSLSWTYGYDLLDRLNSAGKTGLSQTWTYDANGNRLTQGGTASSSYTVSSTSNRLSSVSGALSRTYSYDATGNTTGYGGFTFGYNDAGRMTSVSGGASATYSHNALGQRVKKTVGGVSTYFVYDEAGHLLGEYDGSGNLIQETVWLNDVPVATLRPSAGGLSIYYVHTDHLNTPRKVSRPSDNAILWRWESDPFGTDAANQDPDGDTVAFAYHLRFPGQYLDSETGLNYNYFRDYDSAVGRYVQSDPIGLDGGMNTYSYVGGNPANSRDPRGLFEIRDGSRRADPSRGTIICDGDGGIGIQLPPFTPLERECFADCIQQHEEVHRQDALRKNPRVCAGQKAGVQIDYSNRDEARDSEIDATKVAITCLESKLDPNKCGKCDEVVLRKLIEHRQYLRSARRDQLWPKYMD